MCVICYKDYNNPIPSKETFQNCFENNDDGVGMAWWDVEKEVWCVEKGFMDFEVWYKRFLEMGWTDKDMFIVHFRVGTSGTIKDGDCTHPFPIVEDLKDMRKHKYEAKNIFFHNGVFSQPEGPSSDTMHAVKDWIDPLLPYIDKDPKLMTLMENLIWPSRILLCVETTIYELGGWLYEKGVAWSNDTYKKSKWQRLQNWLVEVADRRSKLVDKTLGLHDANGNWKSPYRKAAGGDFDWDKWQRDEGKREREGTWDEWTEEDDDIKPVLPLVTIDDTQQDDFDSVIAMVKDDTLTYDDNFDVDKAQLLLCCPVCYQDKYLQDTPFNYGDTLCMICGSVFDDKSGDELGCDKDMRKEWLNSERRVA